MLGISRIGKFFVEGFPPGLAVAFSACHYTGHVGYTCGLCNFVDHVAKATRWPCVMLAALACADDRQTEIRYALLATKRTVRV